MKKLQLSGVLVLSALIVSLNSRASTCSMYSFMVDKRYIQLTVTPENVAIECDNFKTAARTIHSGKGSVLYTRLRGELDIKAGASEEEVRRAIKSAYDPENIISEVVDCESKDKKDEEEYDDDDDEDHKEL